MTALEPVTPTTDADRLRRLSKDHLWMPFNPLHEASGVDVPLMVRGEGCWLYDAEGRRYLDTFASICCVAIGHGRHDVVEAGLEQARALGYADIWFRGHPPAIELAARIASLAPENLNRVFFTSGGSEAVESAFKLVRQYHRMRGNAQKTKIIARRTAYHGTTLGALSATGITPIRTPYEPLLPGVRHVPNTNVYRLPDGADPAVFAEAIDEAIRFEGPDTVGAVILEPVQNGGGCIPPPPGYFKRVREICDEHDVLLISDEVICAWGRLGEWFGAQRYDYAPDLLTTAKALTSGYAPLGALLVSDKVSEPFLDSGAPFLHGFTFTGHPVACAIALANLDAFESEGVLDNVRAKEEDLRAVLESFADIPIVGDVRGAGFFQGIEFVKDQRTKASFAPDEALALVGEIRARAWERGLIVRADVRGEPVLQVAPPLVVEDEHLEIIRTELRPVLEQAARTVLGS